MSIADPPTTHPAAAPMPAVLRSTTDGARPPGATKIAVRDLRVHYGSKLAVRDVSLDVREDAVTALIGPSGCGKSTILRCFDRMNDLIPGARVSGSVLLDGEDIYAADVQPVDVRRITDGNIRHSRKSTWS